VEAAAEALGLLSSTSCHHVRL